MKITELQAALDKRNKLESEIPQIQTLLADKTARLAELESGCDLGDEKALAQIGRLQILVALLPRRLAALEAALKLADKQLKETAVEYISKTHGPRTRALNAKAEAKVRKELAPHFPGNVDLDRAVASSALVIESHNLSVSISSAEIFGPVRFAQMVLSAADRADEFEQKLS